MRAVLCTEYGPPEDLVIADVESPALGSGQVRIAVRACGVNFPDSLIVAGKYQVRPPVPFTPGAELAGEIIEVGRAVKHLETGQRVIAMTTFGCMAEEVCVNANAVIPIPDSMDFITAAGFILTYGTAYHALLQRAHLRSGESLLVMGAAGGVGLAAVELGTILNATVFAAASSAEKLQLAAEHGAAHLIDYSNSDLKEQVKDLTSGRGIDVILDPVGGDLFDDCLRSVAWGGRILVVGFASGKIQQIPANLPLLKGSSVVGVFWGRFAELETTQHRNNTKDLLQFFTNGQLKPHISSSYPLQDAAMAIKHVAERRALGKIVIEIC
jgi:NADPH2:quinone reductase